MSEQRRKIIDSRSLLLLNECAFSAGKTYIPREIIINVNPLGVHVLDKYIAFEGYANCYVLLAMEGNFDDPYEVNLEISLVDYNNLPYGMTLHEMEDFNAL